MLRNSEVRLYYHILLDYKQEFLRRFELQGFDYGTIMILSITNSLHTQFS